MHSDVIFTFSYRTPQYRHSEIKQLAAVSEGMFFKDWNNVFTFININYQINCIKMKNKNTRRCDWPVWSMMFCYTCDCVTGNRFYVSVDCLSRNWIVNSRTPSDFWRCPLLDTRGSFLSRQNISTLLLLFSRRCRSWALSSWAVQLSHNVWTLEPPH